MVKRNLLTTYYLLSLWCIAWGKHWNPRRPELSWFLTRVDHGRQQGEGRELLSSSPTLLFVHDEDPSAMSSESHNKKSAPELVNSGTSASSSPSAALDKIVKEVMDSTLDDITDDEYLEEEDTEVSNVSRREPNSDDGDPPDDTVDDIEEIDLDRPVDDEDDEDEIVENSLTPEEMKEMSAVLKTFISPPDPIDEVLALCQLNHTLELGEEKTYLYNQLLKQFVSPLTTTNHQVLDLATVMALEGYAALAQRPVQFFLAPNEPSPWAPRRAIKLSTPSLSNSEGSHAVVHKIMIRALCAATQSHSLWLTDRKVNDMLSACQQCPRLAHLTLTKVDLVKALLGAINDMHNSRVCVVVDGALPSILSSNAASDLVYQELRAVNSRLFVVQVERPAAIRPSSAPAQPAAQQPVTTTTSGLLSGPPGTSSTPLLPPNLSNLLNSMPPFPPQGIQAVRGFQVSINNGTATLMPLPPNVPPPREVLERLNLSSVNGMMPLGLSNLMPSFPFPPQGVTFPMFPPEMSEEEIAEFMADPENGPRIRALLDQVVQTVTQNYLQGMMNGQPGNAGGGPVHVKVAVLNQGNNPLKDHPHPFLQNMNSMRTTPSQGKIIQRVVENSKKRRDQQQNHRSKSRGGANPSNDPVVSPFGEKILAQLFDVSVSMPRDQHYRALWQSVVTEEHQHRVFLFNKRLLSSTMLKWMLPPLRTTLWESLRDILKVKVLSRDQVQHVISTALRFQLGHYTSPFYLLPHVSIAAGAASSASETTDPKQLQYWSLDLALGQVLPGTGTLSRLSLSTQGQGSDSNNLAAVREELATKLGLDKYEKALLSNLVLPGDLGVTYDQIGGLDEVKEVLQQCITYPLKYPKLYNQRGIAAEAVKGLLLFGPPGTGKTMLAKAVATEGGAAFLSIDASTIENKWLGESEKNARAVFSLARKLAPCVVFLDEVDSLLSSREHSDESSHGTLTSVKTTLMQEWDGLRTTADRVVVIASTNRPFDLDEAVLRRLPRRILVDLPDFATRQAILSVSLRHNPLSADVNTTSLAGLLDGYTGSDIKEVCREACVRVAHERAALLEAGGNEEALMDALNSPLRPVQMADFKVAMRKLKASVDEAGREMAKVQEWNEKFGEVRRKGKRKQSTGQLQMYI